jgi:microcystin-dependent protein
MGERQGNGRGIKVVLWGALAAGVVVGAGAVVSASVPHSFNSGDTLKAADLNANFTALDQRLAAVEALLPAGTIIAYGGPALTTADAGAPAPPAGWLLCDGSAISRSTYANLFAAVGINFGGGDGIATFNLPDLRGRFARGADHGAGHDPNAAARTMSSAGGPAGDAVGTLQADAFKSHDHGGQTGVEANYAAGGLWYAHQTTNAQAQTVDTGGFGMSETVVNGDTHTHGITAQGGTETRPVNVAVNYLIKL